MPSLSYRYKGSRNEKVYKIDRETVSAGRLPSNDLPLLDASVSRNHFVIKKELDGYYLYDNGSSNGTILNNKKVQGRTRLHDKDEIAAGSVVLIFHDNDLTTIKEVSAQELDTIAGSPSLLNNIYLDVLFSAARESIYATGLNSLSAKTLQSVCDAIKAEYGAIVLIDEKTGELVLEAANGKDGPGIRGISSNILGRSIKNRAGLLVQNAAADKRFAGDRTIQNMGISSALCAPIWEKDHVYGALYADRRVSQTPFNEDQLNFVTIMANLLALNVAHERLTKKITDEMTLSDQIKRFVPIEAVSGLLDMIKNNPAEMWNVQTADRTTILFADIVGFTSLTEKNESKDIAILLRAFFEQATTIVLSQGGSVNKFLGDGFMAVFGTPLSHPDDTDRAIRSAIKLLEWVRTGNSGIPISLRIGMDTGVVTGIMIGSPQRLEYTIIGNCVNVSSRLQAKADPNQILISSETNRFVQSPINTRLVGEITVKGKENQLRVYEVLC